MIRNALIAISYPLVRNLREQAKFDGLDSAETLLEMILTNHFAANPMFAEIASAVAKASDEARKAVLEKYQTERAKPPVNHPAAQSTRNYDVR